MPDRFRRRGLDVGFLVGDVRGLFGIAESGENSSHVCRALASLSSHSPVNGEMNHTEANEAGGRSADMASPPQYPPTAVSWAFPCAPCDQEGGHWAMRLGLPSASRTAALSAVVAFKRSRRSLRLSSRRVAAGPHRRAVDGRRGPEAVARRDRRVVGEGRAALADIPLWKHPEPTAPRPSESPTERSRALHDSSLSDL